MSYLKSKVGVTLEVVMYPSQAWFRYASCYHTKNQCEMNVYSLHLSKFPLFLLEHQADGKIILLSLSEEIIASLKEPLCDSDL